VRSVESMRQASIQQQVLQIETDLSTIERVVRRVEQANIDQNDDMSATGVLLTSAQPGSIPAEAFRAPRAVGMVELIHEFGDLSASIARLSSLPITVQTDFSTDDFPRETKERLDVLSRCDQYAHALSVKDHMLWTATQEREAARESLETEQRLCERYAGEVASWAQMSQTLKGQVAELQQEKEQMARRNNDLVATLRRYNIYYES
jgi:predicted Fe-S protein YdhL (DUF1289 family)